MSRCWPCQGRHRSSPAVPAGTCSGIGKGSAGRAGEWARQAAAWEAEHPPSYWHAGGKSAGWHSITAAPTALLQHSTRCRHPPARTRGLPPHAPLPRLCLCEVWRGVCPLDHHQRLRVQVSQPVLLHVEKQQGRQTAGAGAGAGGRSGGGQGEVRDGSRCAACPAWLLCSAPHSHLPAAAGTPAFAPPHPGAAQHSPGRRGFGS